MRFLPFVFALAGVSWLGTGAVRAQMLVGTLESAPQGAVNLNASYSFAAYTTTDGSPYTDVGNLGNFSVLNGGGSLSEDENGGIDLDFTGYKNGGSTTFNNDTDLVDGVSGHTVSLASTLFASGESFDFYVGSNTGSVTLTAVLSGPGITTPVTYTDRNVTLSPTNQGSASDGFGDLNLVVSGAQSTDTLTFSIVESDSGNAGYAGLEGVAVVAPEPSTWALLLGGLALLLAWRGRQLA